MKRDEIKLGALLSYVTIFLNTIVGLLYTPFMLRQLGQSEYGLYMLIGSLVAYISILDFGLHNTVYRFIAKYQAEKDEEGQENFLASTFIIYGVITILVFLVGVILYFNLDRIFSSSLTHEELSKANIMFAILIFNLAITLPLGAFQFIIRGYGKFIFANSVAITRIIARTIVLIALLTLGYKSVAIVVVDTVFNIAMGLTYSIYCFSKLEIRIKLHNFNKTVLNEIFSYSIFVFILAMVNQFFWKLGQVALGIVATTAAVAIYALSINLVMYYQQFALGISGVFMPKVSKLIADGASSDDLTNLMTKVGRIQLSILGLVLSGFIVLGKPFILLWAGPDYSEVYWITLMIFLPMTIPMIQTIAEVIIQVKNMQSFKAKAYLLMSGINIIVSILLGRIYGALGVGISTAVSILIFQVFVINLFYKYKLELKIGRFFKEVSKGIIPVMLITTLAGFISRNIPGLSWRWLFFQIIIVSSIYSILMLRFGLTKEEKNTYINPIFIKIKNKLITLIFKTEHFKKGV